MIGILDGNIAGVVELVVERSQENTVFPSLIDLDGAGVVQLVAAPRPRTARAARPHEDAVFTHHSDSDCSGIVHLIIARPHEDAVFSGFVNLNGAGVVKLVVVRAEIDAALFVLFNGNVSGVVKPVAARAEVDAALFVLFNGNVSGVVKPVVAGAHADGTSDLSALIVV